MCFKRYEGDCETTSITRMDLVDLTGLAGVLFLSHQSISVPPKALCASDVGPSINVPAAVGIEDCFPYIYVHAACLSKKVSINALKSKFL